MRRYRWLALVAILSIAVLIWWRLPWTAEERVRLVHRDVIEAFVDGDFGEVWDLMSDGARAGVEEQRALPDLLLLELVGLSSAETATMSAREFFVAFHARGMKRHPREWQRVRDTLTGLTVVSVEFDQSDTEAVVKCRGELLGLGEREPAFRYVLTDGRWRAALPGTSVHMKFLTLERKLEIYLPKTAIAPEDVDYLIEIGPGEVAEEMLANLRRHLPGARAAEAVIVIDAAPTASFQAVISVVSAVSDEGVYSHEFAAAAAPGPPPGLRLNGVPVASAVIPEVPRDHPALRRILGGGR